MGGPTLHVPRAGLKISSTPCRVQGPEGRTPLSPPATWISPSSTPMARYARAVGIGGPGDQELVDGSKTSTVFRNEEFLPPTT